MQHTKCYVPISKCKYKVLCAKCNLQGVMCQYVPKKGHIPWGRANSPPTNVMSYVWL